MSGNISFLQARYLSIEVSRIDKLTSHRIYRGCGERLLGERDGNSFGFPGFISVFVSFAPPMSEIHGGISVRTKIGMSNCHVSHTCMLFKADMPE